MTQSHRWGTTWSGARSPPAVACTLTTCRLSPHVYRDVYTCLQGCSSFAPSRWCGTNRKKNESIIFCSFPAVYLPLSLSLSLSSHISFDCSKKNMTVLLYPLKSDRWLSTSVAIIHMAMYWWSIMFSVRRPLCLGWKPSNPASSSISSSNSLHNQADCPLAPQFFIHTLCWCLSWCPLFTDANVSCLLVCRFICRAAHRARIHTGNYLIIIIIYYSNCILVEY